MKTFVQRADALLEALANKKINKNKIRKIIDANVDDPDNKLSDEDKASIFLQEIRGDIKFKTSEKYKSKQMLKDRLKVAEKIKKEAKKRWQKFLAG